MSDTTISRPITSERFAKGMTFDRYVEYIASPENLAREGSVGPRSDRSAAFRAEFERALLSDDQTAALRWLVAQPAGRRRCLSSPRTGPQIPGATCQPCTDSRGHRHGTADLHSRRPALLERE